MVAVFIVRPMEGYRLLQKRAALVDAAENSLKRMDRDMRTALPASVRIVTAANGFALEMLPTIDGGKYNNSLFGSTYQRLGFFGDTVFDTLGCLNSSAIAALTLPAAINPMRIVVNNGAVVNNVLTNVYQDAGLAAGAESVITPATGLTITLSVFPGPGACVPPNTHRITFSVAHNFRDVENTNRRFFVVTTPVTYLCNQTAGTLTRYADYPIQSAQPTLAAPPPVAGALVVDNVTSCGVDTTTADVRNRGVVTLALGLARDGEQVMLVQQTALANSR
jgi:MSHA biogenesis protein MshO